MKSGLTVLAYYMGFALLLPASAFAIETSKASPGNSSTRSTEDSSGSAVGKALQDEFSKQAQEYARMFKQSDADGLADLWTADGVLETFAGQTIRGKEQLREYFRRNFSLIGSKNIDIKITSLHVPAQGVVIEEGVTSLDSSQSPTAKYMAVHVKAGNDWKMAYVTEALAPQDVSNDIKDMQWLEGNWRASTKEGQNLTMKVKWIEDGHFLECTTYDAKQNSEARQIVGYNPVLHSLVSWHFTPQGGIGRGRWSKVSDGWVQKSEGIMPNGISSSATYILKPRSNDSFTWQSTQRSVAGVSIPDSGVLVLNRVTE